MIEIEYRPDSTIVCRPSGDLDFTASIAFRHVMSDLLRPGLNIVIDLRYVGGIDATGVSALVGSIRRAQAVGGTARISNANSRVKWFVRLVGADRLIEPSSLTLRPGAA
jgi:anti-anti-sigma factor